MSSLVSRLEQELLPKFTDWANRLHAECPNVNANVFSHSVGSLTPYPGHIIGIDCLLAHAPEDHPDNVALGVDVQHLTTVPLIDADVCWGHPSGHAEAQFSYDPQEVSNDVLNNFTPTSLAFTLRWLRQRNAASRRTGTQSAHNKSLYASWASELIIETLRVSQLRAAA